MDDGTMRIAELAKRAGIAPSALRYYEEQGLLSPDGRTEAGYRVYGLCALGRIEFIQRAKALGLTLREIQQLVQEPSDPSTDLARLRHAIAHKLADTERRLAELEALRRDLGAMHDRLGGGTATCGHIGDCECWLPTGKEVEQMAADVRANTDSCSCCGCTCPSDGVCSCCGCPCPQS
jgi:DNA-binding transcriptional MerR regulator